LTGSSQLHEVEILVYMAKIDGSLDFLAILKFYTRGKYSEKPL